VCVVGRVVIGMDPHKRSATIEIINSREQVLGQGRFGTDRDGYRAMLAVGRKHPDRVWAVEGCNGVGRPLAQRLVADGESVVDVPAKLSARARVFSTGHGRKTDPVDAHSVALVGLRTDDLRVIGVDDETVALRLLIDRRDVLGVARTQTVNRIHKDLTATQAKTLLAGVRPRDIAGRTRKRLAGEHVAELVAIDKRIRTANAELRELIAATGSTLLELFGVGPCGAARLLGDVGDISRFTTKARFASWNGTAPLDASSGEQNRHRLSRAGNRRINRVLHMMALTALRQGGEGRVYYDRKLAAGKTKMEALRCLKRRLSDIVYARMRADAQRLATGPGGHPGNDSDSSATGSHPDTSSSEKSLPGPVTTNPRTDLPAAS
jgi:transposase